MSENINRTGKDSMWVSDEEKQQIQDDLEKRHWQIFFKKLSTEWRICLMILPALLVFLFWRYMPMYGLIGAFKTNETTVAVWQRDFVGLTFFKDLVMGQYSLGFWQAFKNTFFISFYTLLFGFPMPIILAILFNEIKSNVVRSAVQVATYLPRFVSTVVVTTLIALLLKAGLDGAKPGILANLFTQMGVVPDLHSTKGMMQFPQYFRAVYVISGIWENAGYDSIVFFAAIIGISPTQYEAANIDGAGKMSQMKYVVLPGMLSTIIIMLIMRIGQLLNVGYEKVLLLYNSETYSTADITATFVFRIAGLAGGAQQSNQAMGSAADLIASLLSMALVVGANNIAKRASDTSLF